MSRGRIINGFMENSLQSLDYPLNTVDKYGFAYSNIPTINFTHQQGLTKINAYGFYNANIGSMDLSNVTSIDGTYIFEYLKNPKEIYLPSLSGNGGSQTAYNSDIKTLIYGIDCTSTAYSQFANATNLEEIYFLSPTMVNAYNFYIFNGATHFVNGDTRDGKIYVPDSLVDSYKVDHNWSNWADLIYPLSEAPKQFDYELYAYAKHIGLTEYDLGEDITVLREYAFSGNTALRTLSCTNVEQVKYRAFYGCINLESIDFKPKIVSGGSFYNCSKLDIDLSELVSVTSTDSFANSGITVADLRNCTTVAIDGWFKNCSKLNTVYIGEGINSIYESSFLGCTVLKNIYVYGNRKVTLTSYTSIPRGLPIEHIYVPSDLVDTYKADSRWGVYASVIEALPTD